jgi:hypothetical protein
MEEGLGRAPPQKRKFDSKLAFFFLTWQWKCHKIRMSKILGMDSKSCQIPIINVGEHFFKEKLK